ncbi:MAG: hypothetical protein JWN78_2713 [Bacteroidota bacterium]|nr:hypothetical protein [Bacteroidota bacterium]
MLFMEKHPFTRWLRHKHIRGTSLFWGLSIYSLSVFILCIIIALKAFNYFIPAISIITCITVCVFTYYIQKIKNHPRNAEKSKEALEDYFFKIYADKPTQDTFFDQSIARMEQFKIYFKWFWISFIFLYASFFVQSIIKMKDFKCVSYPIKRVNVEKESDTAHMKRLTAKYIYTDSLLEIKITNSTSLRSIDSMSSYLMDTSNESNYYAFNFNNISLADSVYNHIKQKEEKADRLFLPQRDTSARMNCIIPVKLEKDHLILPSGLRQISFLSMEKRERTKILEALIRKRRIGQLIISNPDCGKHKNTHFIKPFLAEVMGNTFDFNWRKEDTIGPAYLDTISRQLATSDVLYFSPECYAFVESRILNLHNSTPPRKFYLNKNSLLKEDRMDWIFEVANFLFNNLGLLFLFNCFLILYALPIKEFKNIEKENWMSSLLGRLLNGSDKYNLRQSISKVNKYGHAVYLLLLISYITLISLALVSDNKEQMDSTMTAFNALSGILNGIVFCMLIGRLDSNLIGLPTVNIAILFIYPAIQPMFTAFSDADSLLIVPITLGVAYFCKIYLFFIIFFIIDSGRLLTYFYCFPELNKRINSIFENHFEIIILKDEHHKEYYFEVRNEGKPVYKSDMLSSKKEIISYVEELQHDIREGKSAFIHSVGIKEFVNKNAEEPTAKTIREESNNKSKVNEKPNKLGMNWIEIHDSQMRSYVFSKEFRNKKKLLKFEEKTKEKLPYCKVTFDTFE